MNFSKILKTAAMVGLCASIVSGCSTSSDESNNEPHNAQKVNDIVTKIIKEADAKQSESYFGDLFKNDGIVLSEHTTNKELSDKICFSGKYKCLGYFGDYHHILQKDPNCTVKPRDKDNIRINGQILMDNKCPFITYPGGITMEFNKLNLDNKFSYLNPYFSPELHFEFRDQKLKFFRVDFIFKNDLDMYRTLAIFHAISKTIHKNLYIDHLAKMLFYSDNKMSSSILPYNLRHYISRSLNNFYSIKSSKVYFFDTAIDLDLKDMTFTQEIQKPLPQSNNIPHEINLNRLFIDEYTQNPEKVKQSILFLYKNLFPKRN